jgi:hypothetical protein
MRNLRRINLPRPLARAAVALAAGLALLTILPACGGEEQPADRGGLGVTRLVTVTTTDPMSLPGKQLAATTDTVTLWLGPGVARRDVGGGSLLLHAGVDRLTWLDHRARTWTSQTADEVREQVAALAADSSAVGLAGDEMDRLKSLLRVAVSAKDTGEEREIAGYRCRRWVVEQRLGDQSTTSEIWLTRDVDVDFGLLNRLARPTLAALPGGDAALVELSRMDGVPVLSTAIMTVMNRRGRTETRLVSVDKMVVDPGMFMPPAEYRGGGR